MKNQNTRYIFVYGSLMQGFRNPWSAHLHNHSRFLGKGSAQGIIYDIGGYPGLIQTENPAERVFGEIYYMSSLSLLKDFDRYEGCVMKYLQRSTFTRQIVDAVLRDEQKVQAWTYIYNRKPSESSRIPGGSFTRFFAR